jgi:hypothetical protein
MIHGHGGNINFVRTSLKTHHENRLLASRLIDPGQVSETETESLTELQVAC